MAGVHQITDMKAQAKEIEKSNAQLAKENEELRRFTLDGYMIAKSVKELTDEREIMVSGLKEKDAKIAQLMSDARALRQQLEALGYKEADPVGAKHPSIPGAKSFH